MADNGLGNRFNQIMGSLLNMFGDDKKPNVIDKSTYPYLREPELGNTVENYLPGIPNQQSGVVYGDGDPVVKLSTGGSTPQPQGMNMQFRNTLRPDYMNRNDANNQEYLNQFGGRVPSRSPTDAKGFVKPNIEGFTVKGDSEMQDFVDPSKPGLIDSTLNYLGSPEGMTNLALAFNTMRLTPDDSLAAVLSKKQDNLNKRRGGNATADYLRGKGQTALAELVENNPDLAGQVLTSLKPTSLDEKIKMYKDNPDLFRRMSEAGAFGGNFDRTGQYKAITEDRINTIQRLQETGRNANAQVSNFIKFRDAIKTIGQTGPSEQTKQNIRSFVASIPGFEGFVDENKLNAGQFLTATANEKVATELRLNKGPQTDFDARFAGEYLPSLGMGMEANKKLINYGESVAMQQQIMSDIASEIRVSDIQGAEDMFRKIKMMETSMPSAIPTADGGFMTYKDFHEHPDNKGKSAKQKLLEWTNAYRELKQFDPITL